MLFLLCLIQDSFSVPLQLFQQGRLLESNGNTVEGLHVLTFRLYDAETNGNIIWEEPIAVTLSNGYYSVTLGSNTVGNPLDQNVLIQYPVFLEIAVDNDTPLSPRQELRSTPYAQIAGEAERLVGGEVNASEIQINGTLVVNSDGSWVGPTININWNDIQNVPAGFSDQIDNQITEGEVENFVTNGAIDLNSSTTIGGLPILTSETDTLLDLSCLTGDVPKYDSLTGWYCETDLVLTEEDVESYAFNEPVALLAGSTMDGSTLVTQADSLSAKTCGEGEVLVFSLSSSTWACGTDQNDTLTSAEVQAMVEAVSGIALSAGATVDGSPILSENSNLQWDKIQGAPSGFTGTCNDGEILQYDATAEDWLCVNVFDQDNDGYFSWDDCNDNDSSSFSKSEDGDCDGVLKDDDCNDNDSGNTNNQEDDVDCDGTLTDEDCDDTDEFSTIKSEDGDCDGVITSNDCDDNDASNTLLLDVDCFSQATFTNCNQTGHTGPSQSQCTSEYTGSDIEGKVTVTDGIQYWTVPVTGTYTIEVQGAGGGTTALGSGKGSRMIGDFDLDSGTELKILVGQRGGDNTYGDCDASAGGGTFVAMANNTPLIVAGGGGGGSRGSAGFDATLTETAHPGCGTAGTAGYGGSGSGCSSSYGVGGAGFYGDGSSSGWGSGSLGAPSSFVNGGIGTPAYDSAGAGGFGGGGAGHGNCYIGGPGGGGYSGGGAGSQASSGTGGGGGGSYNSGSNQNNSAGIQSDHGLVVIQLK